MPKLLSVVAACLLASVPVLIAASPATAAAAIEDTHTFVTSFDGTQLQVHLMRTSQRRSDGTAPVLMVAHGFGEAAPSDPDGARLAGAPTPRRVLEAGYDVFTWDARGHGGSQGTAMFDSPDFEVKDVRVLLDWIAAQPGIQLDAPGDPRLGMSGASYGGIIQFLAAAVDNRIDAISPGYTANDLAESSLAKNGKFKEGWGLGLAGMGAVGNIPAGLMSPLGPQLHLLDPAALSGLSGSIATGTVTPVFRAYLDPRSPSTYLGRINVPTLIQGGTPDTLFPVENLVRDFTALKTRGVPVKMVWNCEGHSLCPGSTGPLEDHFNDVVITWMDRWVKRDAQVKTGPEFEWLADNESTYRTAVAYPPRHIGALRGAGTAQLPLLPTGTLDSAGFVFIGAQPALDAVNVPIAAPVTDVDIVGTPRLTLTYSGTALPGKTWIYAQILDNVTHRVVNVQVTPVPLQLDGVRRTTTIDLNAIATRGATSSRFQLQLMTGSAIFGLQRSTGLVQLHAIAIELPVIDPTRKPEPGIADPS